MYMYIFIYINIYKLMFIYIQTLHVPPGSKAARGRVALELLIGCRRRMGRVVGDCGECEGRQEEEGQLVTRDTTGRAVVG